MNLRLTVNGRGYTLDLDPRESLLDVLRERLHLTGTKKGCDQGACGACTVHIDGRRVLSCLTLAARCEGKQVTTIEGVSADAELHPLQRAMIEHDGLQCGYCTPGQIMSGIAGPACDEITRLVKQLAGEPSHEEATAEYRLRPRVHPRTEARVQPKRN